MNHSFANIRDSASRYRAAGNWSDLASMFAALGRTELPVDMLLLKAAAIQLAEDSHGLSLEDAKAALELACDLDPVGVQAEIELGHFLFSVEDSAETALQHFEAALLRCDSGYVEALCGMAKAINELRGADAAVDLLRSSRAAEAGPVQRLIAELVAIDGPSVS